MLSRTVYYIILAIAGSGVVAAMLSLYLARARRRWAAIIAEALRYHRYHFESLAADKSVDPAIREYARALRRAVDQQLADDVRRGMPGLKGIALAFAGAPSALAIVAEVYYQIFRTRRRDEVILRLLETVRSALYRYYLLHSVIMPLALACMDLALVRARLGEAASGPAGLYNAIHAGMKTGKNN